MGSWRIYRLSLVMSENLHWKLFPIYNNPSPPLQASPRYGVEGLCSVAVGSKVTLLPIPFRISDFFGISYPCIYDLCHGIYTSESCYVLS